MTAGNYKIWAVGDAIYAGSSPLRHIGVAGVAKAASVELPHLVANEFICSTLARALMLPMPPGFLIEHEDAPWFVSLNFNLAGEDLPPARAQRIVDALPRLATGITLFDIWVANRDRHRGNLAFDAHTERLQIFDHGSALFVGGPTGMENLRESRGKLGVPGHCLINRLTSTDEILRWLRRIRDLPEWMILETFEGAYKDAGLITEEMAKDGSAFLLERRANLEDVIRENLSAFTALEDGLFSQGMHDEE